MTLKNGRIIAISIALILAIAASLFVYLNSPADNDHNAVSVRLAWVYDMAEVGLFVGQDRGAFSDENIDVKIEPGGFGLDPIRLVAAGTNDFGVAGAGNLLLARAQGIPVVAIGAEFQNTPVGFIVRRNSGISSFADFKGKRVGVQTGADTDVLYRALLARNNMSSSDVREVPIQYDAIPFVSGQIDVLPGYVTNQPVTLQRQGIDVDVISAASEGLEYYGNVYFTTERMIDQHPDVVRAFLRAVYNGWMITFEDKSAAIAAIQSRSEDFDEESLSKIYDSVMPFIKEPDGSILRMTKSRWETTKNVLEAANLLTKEVNLSEVYTNDFLD